MWRYSWKDYPTDTPLKEEWVEPGKGIIGVEMHELTGWGELHHLPCGQWYAEEKSTREPQLALDTPLPQM